MPKVLGGVERGKYPHAVESFVALGQLEGFAKPSNTSKMAGSSKQIARWIWLKRTLINEVSTMTARMHQQGINHRDCYLCHYLVNRSQIKDWQPGLPLEVTLIDLHRVQQRKQVPRRWLVKDLRSLLFSAMDVGLTSADCGRFLSAYLRGRLEKPVPQSVTLVETSPAGAVKMYCSWHSRRRHSPNISQT